MAGHCEHTLHSAVVTCVETLFLKIFQLFAHVLSCVILTNRMKNLLTHSQFTNTVEKKLAVRKTEWKRRRSRKNMRVEQLTLTRCTLDAPDENRTHGCKNEPGASDRCHRIHCHIWLVKCVSCVCVCEPLPLARCRFSPARCAST